MKLVMAAAALSILTGCATTESSRSPQAAETIRYETTPCFGACPVYAVTVSSDGTGIFTGTRFTAAAGDHRFTLSRAQFDDFRARLAPYRPARGEHRIASGAADCGPMRTDQPSLSVSWQGGGAAAGLSLDTGCSAPALAAMRRALAAAPDALPVAALVGKH